MRREAHRAALALLALAALSAPGCRGRWGNPQGDERFIVQKECWELPMGLCLAPVAVLEAPLSLAVTLLAWLVNPINWLLDAIDLSPVGPNVSVFPLTTIALTLVDPEWNLDLTRPMPEDALGLGWMMPEPMDEEEGCPDAAR